MNKQQLAAFNTDLRAALQVLKDKHNLDVLKTGTLRYDESGFNIKIEATFAGADTKEMVKLKQSAELYGFKSSICNATITYRDDVYQVMGLRTTNLLIKKVSNDTVYLAPVDSVLKACRLKHPEHTV